MMHAVKNSRRILLGAMLALASSVSLPQAWASSSIIVPYSAGGSSDGIARITAPYLAKAMGSDVIVENVAGATGAIAINRVLNADADGRLIFQGTAGEMIIPPLTNDAIKFKPDDLEAVHPITVSNLVLVVRKDLPVNSVEEFIALAKEKSKTQPLTYGTPGVGSLYHLIVEAMGQTADAEVVHVPYKGAAPMLQDLIADRIDFTVMTFIRSMPGAVEAGHYKILANMSTQKQPELKHLPTISEFPEFKNIDFRTGSTLVVKKGTPLEIKERLNKAIAATMANEELVAKLEAEGRQASPPMSLKEAEDAYKNEVSQYEMVIGLTGFKASN